MAFFNMNILRRMRVGRRRAPAFGVVMLRMLALLIASLVGLDPRHTQAARIAACDGLTQGSPAG